jgi:ATP-dependent Clp endopeptidase proteolytic subunit ClpP
MTTPNEWEIAKLQAETREIEARVAAAEANQARAAARHKAVLNKSRIEAVTAEAQSRREVLTTETMERELAAKLAAFEFQHIYQFSGAQSEASVKACIVELNKWHRTAPGCDIEIVFNSPGGDVLHGLALFDYIQTLRRSGHKVTTTALGMAASMAGILLQAGDVRVMSKESWLLIHEIAFGSQGKIGDVEDTVIWAKRIQQHVIDIFVSRSGGKLKASYLRAHWSRKDWWLDSDEAMKLGLIDEIR